MKLMSIEKAVFTDAKLFLFFSIIRKVSRLEIDFRQAS